MMALLRRLFRQRDRIFVLAERNWRPDALREDITAQIRKQAKEQGDDAIFYILPVEIGTNGENIKVIK